MGAHLSGPSGRGGRAIEQNAEINVTPFVEIMLVLLIIFMVAGPLATASLKLDLPPPEGRVVEPKGPVYVTIQTSGDLFIASRPTTMGTLAADVCAAVGGDHCTDERVFVRVPPDVTYDRFIAVMNNLQANGFLQVGLFNEDIE